MNLNRPYIKEVFIRALIDSVPNQLAVDDKIYDPVFFESNNLKTLFEELGIESLGTIWFLTIIEEQLDIKIEEPGAFFTRHGNQSIEEVIDSIICVINTGPNG